MADWSRRWLLLSAGILGSLGGLPGALAGEGPTLRLEVDARDLPRRLMHSRIEIPCKPGKLAALVSEVGPGHPFALRAGAGRRGAPPRDSGG